MHLLEVHVFQLNVTSLSSNLNSIRNIFINLHVISFDSSRKFRTISCRLQTSLL